MPLIPVWISFCLDRAWRRPKSPSAVKARLSVVLCPSISLQMSLASETEKGHFSLFIVFMLWSPVTGSNWSRILVTLSTV